MMTTQSEYELELALIKQLEGFGYEKVSIANEAQMLSNLKTQLERHNQIEKQPFTETEFKKIISHLTSDNSVFERAKILRDRYPLQRDDGTTKYITFLNTAEWCMNEYQVTHQVKQGEVGSKNRKTRFDVTILINGFPLIQVELKKRGIELKEAFNQVDRYHRDAFWQGHGLYLFTQLFVISNGVNTKYYANNYEFNFEQTFFWADVDNNLLTDLHEFSEVFLRPCHASKMITHYTVLNESNKCLMVLRPYQFYAVEALIERVEKSDKNAYIWHTTGSGKTLTSFKASQVIMNMPEVHKVMFVVDRKDLDYQTAKEFNSFAKDSVDSTTDTSNLVRQLNNPDTKLIVTTIQKLNNAITNTRHLGKVEHLKDEKFVFIFDECHRSQFGDTHQNIKKFFNNAQMFGFTGTPIFAENVNKSVGIPQTTKDLFAECLHKYVIVDAIRDQNVLKFAVEYVGKYKRKASANELDIAIDDQTDAEVQGIDKKEALESDDRINKITQYILQQHDLKTKKRQFTAMFCVSSVEVLIRYYDKIKQQQADLKAANPAYKPLKVATIFSFTANEEDPKNQAIIGQLPEEDLEGANSSKFNQSSRDKLDGFIADYNAAYNTKFSTNDTQSFYNYYKDIAKRTKDHPKLKPDDQIDIVLVVNMFLTGFDAKTLNTLYVDKNLRYHGLVQAFSRTNRILNEKKSHGNIICFRNLKKNADDAIALFSNRNAKETVFVKPYEEYLTDYQQSVDKLLEIAPTIKAVDQLEDEEAQLNFVTAFRELLRLKNILSSFADYNPAEFPLSEQDFEDYQSKYLDLYDHVKRKKDDDDKESILDDVDFEVSLIHRDEINVRYILNLLRALSQLKDEEEKAVRKKDIMDVMSTDVNLRSKRELIQKFINENMPKIHPEGNLDQAFEDFWDIEKLAAAKTLCDEEQIDPLKFKDMIEHYVFANQLPREDQIGIALTYMPKILERKKTLKRVHEKVKDYIDTFIDGMGGI
jgi:type I restriction enzyme R subunit